MAIWATLFLETWKRVNASIQYDWDVLDYEKDELPRPEFYGTGKLIFLILLYLRIYNRIVKLILFIRFFSTSGISSYFEKRNCISF
jgi:hypothetical protein